MGVTVYGPDATWPVHQKPYWRSALKDARAAGWIFKHLGAPHLFGVVVCPAGEHSFSVDCTARGGETKAKEVPKHLRSCPHGRAPAGETGVERRRRTCEEQLSRAEELIAQATADLEQAREQQWALAEIDRIELLLDTAARTVSEILLAEQDQALDRAVESADAPSAEAIERTLDDADDVTEGAVLLVSRIRRREHRVPLTHRADVARADIRRLRDDLERL